ncbi:8537_t:CDS:1 [Ambispora leptoticha]|uniref:8537_t:CDS:1 n=1 Tax=Ambispora leptoticha TaxID=144679 RepID=A0A9N8ZWI1_9GLOM|nr:8537_t:CDS:1 [Ambispora leptoticha]
MNFIQIRRLTTKIPIPPVLSVERAGTSAADTARINRLINFYKKVPKGPRPIPEPKSLIDKYRAKYIHTNSAMPLVHIIAAVMGIGYLLDYQFHLSKSFFGLLFDLIPVNRNFDG